MCLEKGNGSAKHQTLVLFALCPMPSALCFYDSEFRIHTSEFEYLSSVI
jgi:hypothetical protein